MTNNWTNRVYAMKPPYKLLISQVQSSIGEHVEGLGGGMPWEECGNFIQHFSKPSITTTTCQYLSLCIFSIWLFLSCILYNISANIFVICVASAKLMSQNMIIQPQNVTKYWYMYATEWLNLETLMPNRRIQLQKVTYCKILFIWNVQNRQFHRAGSELVVSRGKGKGNEKTAAKIWGFFWSDENPPELDRGDGSTVLNVLFNHWLTLLY